MTYNQQYNNVCTYCDRSYGMLCDGFPDTCCMQPVCREALIQDIVSELELREAARKLAMQLKSIAKIGQNGYYDTTA